MIPAPRFLPIVAALSLLAACAPAPSSGPDAAGSASGTAASSAAAVQAFTGSLPDSTRRVAVYSLESPERQRMFFVPTVMVQGGRGGLPLSRMTPVQREAAWRLLGTGLSGSGLAKARAITDNEVLLRGIELADTAIGDQFQRNPLTYFVSVFGAPSTTEPWGWRFEGHHLSVHATGFGNEAMIVAPLFMGANPHRVLAGPTAGSRVLGAEEDVGRELVRMLDAPRAEKAIFSAAAYRDIQRRNDPAGRPLALEGLAAGEMTAQQSAKLRQLLEVYASRMTPAAAREQMARIDAAGFQNVHFIWSGATEPGKAHYYRIHGPTVLVEYDNAQNNANHSHTVWRDLQNDFGGDLLQKHYQAHPHPG
jgi:hypothetical protein